MESEDDIDMHDANNESGEDEFYSGGDDDAGALAAYDDSDADVADYEFIDNDSYDSDDLVSHRHQVFDIFFFFGFCFICFDISFFRI